MGKVKFGTFCCRGGVWRERSTNTSTRTEAAEWRSGWGVGFRTEGSLVRTPDGAHFVVALSKSHLRPA